MKKYHKEAGIIAIEVILFVVLAIAVGAVGYKVMQSRAAVEESSGNIDGSEPILKQATIKAPEIKTKADLNTASQTLDQINLGDSSLDTTQLDQQLSF